MMDFSEMSRQELAYYRLSHGQHALLILEHTKAMKDVLKVTRKLVSEGSPSFRNERPLIDEIRRHVRLISSAINRNTSVVGSEHIPPLPVRKAKPRSASRAARTAAADTDSGGGGPDDPDPDPDPQRPYIALGIDHKATTPAGPPVLAVLRPFTDLNTVTARLCRYETRQHHTGPQGPDSTPS